MRKGFFLLFILFTSSLVQTFAKDNIGLVENFSTSDKKKKEGGFDKSKLFFGGGIGGGGLPNGFAINVAPSVGYQFAKRFHAGVNLGYLYARQRFEYTNNSYEMTKSNVYTTGVFARYFPLDVLFIQARPELNLIRNKYEFHDGYLDQTTKEKFKYNIPSFLVGAGYVQGLGGNAYTFISVMYDIVQNPNSPYYRVPVFEGGIALGIFGIR